MIFVLVCLLLGIMWTLREAQTSLDTIAEVPQEARSEVLPEAYSKMSADSLGSRQDVRGGFQGEPGEKSFVRIFFRSGILALQSLSMKSSLASSSLRMSIKVLSLREHILRLCLSPFSFLPLLLWSAFVFQVNATYIFGIGSALLVILSQVGKKMNPSKRNRWLAPTRAIVRFILFLGLSLFLFEQLLRIGSQVLMMAHEFSWIFFLSQSPLENGLILFVIAILISLVFSVQGWSLVASLGLLTLGLLAFNNAIFVVAGELFVLPWAVFFSVRKSEAILRQRLLQYSFVWSLGVGLMSFLFLAFKNQIFSTDVGSLAQIELRFSAMIVVFSGLLFGGFFATMLWGHFASKKKTDELAPIVLAGLESLAFAVESKRELKDIEQLSQSRRAVLVEQAKELEAGDFKLIPPVLKQKHSDEIQTISAFLNILKQVF